MAEEEPPAKRVKVIDATSYEEDENDSNCGDVADATFNLLAKLQDELDQACKSSKFRASERVTVP